jgi:hypothetical protein
MNVNLVIRRMRMGEIKQMVVYSQNEIIHRVLDKADVEVARRCTPLLDP